MSRKLMIVAGLAITALGIFILGANASAQVKKGKTRPAETKYLMRGIVQPNCASLGKMLKGDGPTTDKEWDAAACHAACLNEASFLLMSDGRCPDGKWAAAAKTTLREGSAATLAACEKKDLKAASAAFKKMTQSCAACHKAHKGK